MRDSISRVTQEPKESFLEMKFCGVLQCLHISDGVAC
jgi:hypothetical protein